MTSVREPQGGLVLLDARCLINLFASGSAEEILRALPYRWAVARYVLEEGILEIEAEDEAPDERPPPTSAACLRPTLLGLIERGVLAELDVGSQEEEAELVRFAAELDDGEGHTCALAITRQGRVATDDKKAIRVLRAAWSERGHDGDPVLRTSDLSCENARQQDHAVVRQPPSVHSRTRTSATSPAATVTVPRTVPEDVRTS